MYILSLLFLFTGFYRLYIGLDSSPQEEFLSLLGGARTSPPVHQFLVNSLGEVVCPALCKFIYLLSLLLFFHEGHCDFVFDMVSLLLNRVPSVCQRLSVVLEKNFSSLSLIIYRCVIYLWQTIYYLVLSLHDISLIYLILSNWYISNPMNWVGWVHELVSKCFILYVDINKEKMYCVIFF